MRCGFTTIRNVERQRDPTCLVCGDRIGVYEPAIVFERDESWRCTSLAREPMLWHDAEARFAHLDCLDGCRG